MPVINFLLDSEKIEFTCDSGTNLMEAVVEAGIELKAVCGGAGSCGKCQVIVKEGEVNQLAQGSLSPDKLKQGYVLACQTEVIEDVRIEIPPESRLSEHQIFVAEEAEDEELLTEKEIQIAEK